MHYGYDRFSQIYSIAAVKRIQTRSFTFLFPDKKFQIKLKCLE